MQLDRHLQIHIAAPQTALVVRQARAEDVNPAPSGFTSRSSSHTPHAGSIWSRLRSMLPAAAPLTDASDTLLPRMEHAGGVADAAHLSGSQARWPLLVPKRWLQVCRRDHQHDPVYVLVQASQKRLHGEGPTMGYDSDEELTSPIVNAEPCTPPLRSRPSAQRQPSRSTLLLCCVSA